MLLRKCKDKPQMGRKYLQWMYLTKYLNSEYTKNSYNQIIEVKTLNKNMQRRKQTFPRRRWYMNTQKTNNIISH